MNERIQLLEKFNNTFNSKYALVMTAPLGSGAYGEVYEATDLDRKIKVAIKLFHDGHAPAGSERAWHLTSRLMHHQVVPTYTVETYLGDDGLQYKAVVSRFVPGKSLRNVFDWWNNQAPQRREFISEDFSKSLLPSLVDALYFCHKNGFGHGDLHEGNIMVLPIDYGKKNSFQAILIDFDNASFKIDLVGNTETEKIEKDIRLLARLASYIMQEWKWGIQLSALFQSYTTIEEIKFSYQSALTFVSALEKEELNFEHDLYFSLKLMIPRMLGGFKIQPLVEVFRNMTMSIGKGVEFEVAFEKLKSDIMRSDALSDDVEIMTVNVERFSFYQSIFG